MHVVVVVLPVPLTRSTVERSVEGCKGVGRCMQPAYRCGSADQGKHWGLTLHIVMSPTSTASELYRNFRMRDLQILCHDCKSSRTGHADGCFSKASSPLLHCFRLLGIKRQGLVAKKT